MKKIMFLLCILSFTLIIVSCNADSDLIECRRCGEKIEKNSRFCSYCGESFETGSNNSEDDSDNENQNNTEEFAQDSISSEETPVVEDVPATEDFAKNDDEEDKKEENDDDKKDNDDADDKKEEEDDAKKKFELLEAEHAELQSKYAALEASYQELVEFKKQIEDKEKDDLIASFYMLSDEDKAEVIANKANYSLKEIKAELSMICVDKKVNFNLNDEEKELEKPLTYNLSQSETVSKPAWLKAVEDTQKRLNN